jgi:hypothetical protein
MGGGDRAVSQYVGFTPNAAILSDSQRKITPILALELPLDPALGDDFLACGDQSLEAINTPPSVKFQFTPDELVKPDRDGSLLATVSTVRPSSCEVGRSLLGLDRDHNRCRIVYENKYSNKQWRREYSGPQALSGPGYTAHGSKL